MKSNRRIFLKTAAAGTWAMTTIPYGYAAERKINMGVIGCGWYGMVDARAAVKARDMMKAGDVEIAALCDVDSEHLKNSADEIEKLQGKRPTAFKNYQDLLALKELDALILAPPPHWHALPFIAACERGLDIYCEKPLAYDLREGRAMAVAAQKCGRVIQIGFQRRQSGAIDAAKKFIQSGGAGKINQAEAQIHYNAGVKDEDLIVQDPPASLDWDLWSGPAPKLPYRPQIGHFKWRLEKTTGHGHLVDWGIHLIDAARLILEETAPKRITASGGLYYYKDKITTPDTLTVCFEFERCPLVWRHRIWGAEEYDPNVSNGIFFYGDLATVFVSDDKWIVIPKGKNKERREEKIQTDAGLNHMMDFLHAVRNRKQPSCLISDAFHSTASVQLAMIAFETQSSVVWNEKTEQIEGNEKADALLKREYRAPWKHPFTG
ncbi:MAG: Gfo/Idh/MocA family oxidoreductase [Candidatus Omnitrophota bacterium]